VGYDKSGIHQELKNEPVNGGACIAFTFSGFYPLIRLLSDAATELPQEVIAGLGISGFGIFLLPKILEFFWAIAFALSVMAFYSSVREDNKK